MKLIDKLAFEAADDYCQCKEGEPCFANAYMEAYRVAFHRALQMAADKAENWGYTFDYNKEYQPWAKRANLALRVQNKEISKEILKIGEEDV